jgi:hypothetical protein
MNLQQITFELSTTVAACVLYWSKLDDGFVNHIRYLLHDIVVVR